MFYVFCGVVCQRQARITCQRALWDDCYLPQCLTSVTAATRAFASQSEKLRLLFNSLSIDMFKCIFLQYLMFNIQISLKIVLKEKMTVRQNFVKWWHSTDRRKSITWTDNDIFGKHIWASRRAATNFPASPRISGLGSLSVLVPSRTHNKVSEMSFFFSSCDSSSAVLW